MLDKFIQLEQWPESINDISVLTCMQLLTAIHLDSLTVTVRCK